MTSHKELAIKALENMKGDDTARAQRAFGGLSEAQMNEEYGASGKTRKEILGEYLAHDEKVDDAIDWIRSL